VLPTVDSQAPNGGGYCTRPVTPFSAPGTNSLAMKDSPPGNGEARREASSEENPNRG